MVYLLVIFLKIGLFPIGTMQIQYKTLDACREAKERVTENKAVCVEMEEKEYAN